MSFSIQKVYKTSRGFFWSIEEAQRKENCEKIYDRGGSFAEYETPKGVFVLIDDTKEKTVVFQLQPIEMN